MKRLKLQYDAPLSNFAFRFNLRCYSTMPPRSATSPSSTACWQGLSIVNIPAQRKRFLWHRGCILGLFIRCLGVFRVYFVSETAQVEIECG
jgi:hypothetical protein